MENIGFYDKIIRFVLGAVLVVLPFFEVIRGYEWLSVLIGLALVSTALIGYCPVYRFLGISTKKSVKIEFRKGQKTKSKKGGKR